MDIIILLLTILMSFVGLGCGIALSYIAKEELKHAKKIFIILQIMIAVLILVFVFLDYQRQFILTSLIFLFGFPSGSLIMYERFSMKKICPKTYIIYSAIYISFVIILSTLQLIQ